MADSNDKPESHSTGSKKSSICQQRWIKVHSIQYTQPLKNKDQPSKEMCVPWIRIQGLWLQRAGFVINSPVKVRVMEGCVVLTVAD